MVTVKCVNVAGFRIGDNVLSISHLVDETHSGPSKRPFCYKGFHSVFQCPQSQKESVKLKLYIT